MSDRPVYTYESDVGNALRRAADATTPTEQRELLHLFASYLETEFDRAAGRTQTIIGNVEIKVREQVGEIHSMVRELGTFLREQRAEQQAEHRAVLAGQEGLRIEVGQQLAALGERIDHAERSIAEHDAVLTRLAERMAALEARRA